MAETYDAIIIGAGIMGCATALELSRRGLRVAVLEKSNIGAGSTGKSSAIIRQHYSNPTTIRMASHSLRVFQNFKQAVAGESGFTQTGFLVLTPEKDVEGLRANVRLQRELGVQTELINRDEILSRWPYLEGSGLVEAAFEPESGFADPNLTLQGYVQASRGLGATFFQDTPVTGVHMQNGKIQQVDTPKQSFSSSLVINCAGPWGAQVARMVSVEVPINPCRVQVAFFRRPEAYAAGHPVVADFIHAVYWRTETGGLTMVGLIDPEEENYIVDTDAYNEKPDFDFILDAGNRLVSRFPGLEASESAGGFAALYAITPDWHPIMDEIIPGSGFYICAGFSGHGFKLGPAVGLMTADMVLGKQTPGMDRHLFRLNRYAESQPVR
ncbi:MAG: FAD-binding oxidoreductase, partial [Anaerolineales bacterium]